MTTSPSRTLYFPNGKTVNEENQDATLYLSLDCSFRNSIRHVTRVRKQKENRRLSIKMTSITGRIV